MLVLALAAGLVSLLALRAHQAIRPASAPRARVSSPGNCMRTPHVCGMPDAADTGVPEGTALRAVPGQVASGKGWRYDPAEKAVDVTGNWVRLTGLALSGDLSISGSHVTVSDDRIITAGYFGISLRHARDVTITHTTVSGRNAGHGRVNYAIDDIYGDSTGLVIRLDNIANWRIGVNAVGGLITGNYIHSPGYLPGDHTDGIYDAGGTTPQIISDNTIMNNLGQTCAIMLESVKGQRTGNKTITGNLLAGGGYVIYAGGAQRDSSHIVITDNRFDRTYFSASGRYGPIAQFQPAGPGNSWSGNSWAVNGLAGDTRGHVIRSPLPSEMAADPS